MKNTFGNSVAVTLFGESHGEYIGAVIDGLSSGIEVDKDYINHMLFLRRPDGKISTPRKEKDDFSIISGVVNGRTTGTPVTILIPNENFNSSDYVDIRTVARPSHADYTAQCKYHGFQDPRGGGHFSGRITAALVAAGAVCKSALEKKGVYIGTHVKKCGGVSDYDFNDYFSDIKKLNNKYDFIYELEEFYNKEIKIFEEKSYEVPYTTMNIGTINGGSAKNSVSANCASSSASLLSTFASVSISASAVSLSKSGSALSSAGVSITSDTMDSGIRFSNTSSREIAKPTGSSSNGSVESSILSGNRSVD